jgi:hypothetical protein
MRNERADLPMSGHASGGLTPSAQNLVQETWPVVVTQASRDKKVSPIRSGQLEHPLELLPIASSPDDQRSLNPLWILAAGDGGGKLT